MDKQIQVFVRLLPVPDRDWQCLQVSDDKKDIYIKNPIMRSAHREILQCFNGEQVEFLKFSTSGIISNVSQEEVYLNVCQDLLVKLFKGENVIVMANGQHGSGKSFTMTGYSGLYENRGITLHLVDDLFCLVNEKKKELIIEVYITYIEFISYLMTDLLTDPATRINHLKKATKLKVTNNVDVLKNIVLADRRRKIEGENIHCGSSVLTIHLKCSSTVTSEPYNYLSSLQLVELCATESVNVSPLSFECQRKANQDGASMSLYFATNNAPKSSKSPSKLVAFLSNTWNNSNIRIITHLNPTVEKWGLNLSSLIFTSHLLRRPMISLCLERTTNPMAALKLVVDMIEKLEEELVVREMILGNGFKHNSTIGQEEMRMTSKFCQQFLDGSISLSSLLSIAHPHVIIRALKQIFEKMRRTPGWGETAVPSLMKNEKSGVRVSNSKKKLLAARKSKTTMDLSSQLGSATTEPCVIPVTYDSSERTAVEMEFLNRHPELRNQLDTALINYRKSMCARDETYMKYQAMKKEVKKRRLLDEDQTWRRKLNWNVEKNVAVPPSRMSAENIEVTLQIARRDAIEALNTFTDQRNLYTQIKTEVNLKIQDYTSDVYGSNIYCLAEDRSDLCIIDDSMKPPVLSDDRITDELSKIQTIFYNLQTSNKMSTSKF